MEALEKQIAEWKKKYGNVYELEVDGKKCWLKSPDRKILAMASVESGADEFKFNEIILENCWIAGDDEIKSEERLFLGVCRKISYIVDVAEATIKKL